MTVEELKQEAKKLGYNIIKIPDKVKKLNCICGASSRYVEVWTRFDGNMFCKCRQCHKQSYFGRNKNEAIKNWNWSVENNEFI